MLIRISVFLISIFLLTSCGNSNIDYCSKLKKLAADDIISDYLKSWVYQNIENRDLRREDIALGGLKVPGRYFYPTEFNWELLSFRSDAAQVRLIGPDTSSFENGRVTGIKSVVFIEKSRYGILVKANRQDDFGLGLISLESFSRVSDEIGVLCLGLER